MFIFLKLLLVIWIRSFLAGDSLLLVFKINVVNLDLLSHVCNLKEFHHTQRLNESFFHHLRGDLSNVFILAFHNIQEYLLTFLFLF